MKAFCLDMASTHKLNLQHQRHTLENNMSIVNNPKRLALVVIDTTRQRYTRYVGAQQDRAVEGDWLTEREVEHFRINPMDFIGMHCASDVA